jgi:mannose-6-phosphate isomerase-like protein (cupin superfamily)
MTTNRRELCISLAALGAFATEGSEGQSESGAEPTLNHSELFPFDSLKAKTSANGMESRPVVHGTLATGEFVEVHESTLPPGEMPHPPHRHTHSEFLLIRDGKLEVVSDGKTGIIGPGGVIFTASAVLHSLKNIGATPAHYFVVAVGLQKSLA